MMTNCTDKYESIQKLIVDENHAAAITALDELLVEFGDFAAAHFDMGNLYYASGHKDKALAHYQKSAELAPENIGYLKNLADLLYIEYKDIDRALELYQRILSARPEDIQTLMITGHLCVSMERFEDALGFYQRILDIEPWNGEAHRFVGQLESRTVGVDMELGPEAIYQRCQEMVEEGRLEKAIDALESLVDRYPDFGLAYNDLGVLYYQCGQKDRSVQHYEKALSIEPDNANFRKNLADFYLTEHGSVERALEIYLAVLNDNPEDIDALMVAGHICSALGKTTSAITFYDRVLDVEPWNIDASDRLEQLQNGRP